MSIAIIALMIYHTALAAPTWPLRISGNGRYLEDQSGVPFFINADTGWEYISSADSVLSIDYLNNRRDKGFNAILVDMLTERYFNCSERYENANGDPPFNNRCNPDFANPLDPYFNHAQWFIEQGQQRDMLMIATVAYHGCCGEGWVDKLAGTSDSAVRAYGRYLGQKFQNNKNIMWVMNGDSDGGGVHGKYVQIMEGIKETIPNALFTSHNDAPALATDHFPEVNVNNVYTYEAGQVTGQRSYNSYKLAWDAWQHSPAMPYYLYESQYDTYYPRENIRRNAYWVVTYGGMGHTYGSNEAVWFCYSDARDYFDLPGTFDMSHLRTAITANNRQWWTLEPDHDHQVITSDYGSFNDSNNPGGFDYVTTGRSIHRNFSISYIPSTGDRTLAANLEWFSNTSQVEAKWFDPTNGSTQLIGTYPANGSQNFATPGNNSSGATDWVLILEGPAIPPLTSPELVQIEILPEGNGHYNAQLTWTDPNSDPNEEEFIIQRKVGGKRPANPHP